MRSRRSAFAISSGILMMAGTAFGQQYHSNDLTPPVVTAAKLMGASTGKQVGGGNNNHAYLLKGNALAATDLHPAGYWSSVATASDDIEECGYGSGPLGGIHALKWSGSAASAVDLGPSGYNMSYCFGVDNGQQVGFAQNQVYFITASHAMLWSGTPTPVDLHPATTYPYSRATGIKGGEQVGYVSSFAYPVSDQADGGLSRAYRWAGTAASGVDLHPALFDGSEAMATNGVQQGGWGYSVLDTVSPRHALLWSGTAQSVVDLSSPGFINTRILAMSATQQVGEGWVGTVRHALLWSGTADTVLDLNQYLPPGYINAVATGIDAAGNVVGYADGMAVVFAPGQPAAAALSSVSLTPANVAPGDLVQGAINLAGPAPAGGVTLTFLSTNLALAATPASIVIPEGQTSATFTVAALGLTLTAPQSVKIYVTDGTVSKVAPLIITPIVHLSTLTANPVEGGFTTYGTLALSIPAQTGGAVVSLVSGNPALVTVPAGITVPALSWGLSFSTTTSAVTAITLVPVTATFNGETLTTQVSLNPAPVVSVSAVIMPAVVGGQSFTGVVTVTNFPRGVAGATVTLVSGDSSVKVPATVLIPQGAYSVSFAGTTSVVQGFKNVSVKATYNGSNITGLIAVSPVPTVTIISAEYFLDTKLFKVQANTTFANSILTYGTDPNSGPLGTMQIELGVWKGSMLMATAPAQATVWNSNGGQATMVVTVKTGLTGGGGGGGGTTSTFKLTTSKNGKGTLTVTPLAASYAPGTVVTITETPDPGSLWIGWSGACSGTATTCTVTMNSNLSVTANFK